MTNNTGE